MALNRAILAALMIILATAASAADAGSRHMPGIAWRTRLNSRYELIAYGTKATDFKFMRRNLRTGRETPVRELNSWFFNWNHHHIAFSPNGRWAAWRDVDNILVACTLDGRMKRVLFSDGGNEHSPIYWLRDNRHFVVVGGYSEDPAGSGIWRCHSITTFDRLHPARLTSRRLSPREAVAWDKRDG